MRVTIPIDLSTRSFIPLPRFFNSRRAPPLLHPSLTLLLQQLSTMVFFLFPFSFSFPENPHSTLFKLPEIWSSVH
jgi:hypothetical protein